MAELFDEDEDDIEQSDESSEEVLERDDYQVSPSDARRRLESMLAEKKLRDELEDLFDDLDDIEE